MLNRLDSIMSDSYSVYAALKANNVFFMETGRGNYRNAEMAVETAFEFTRAYRPTIGDIVAGAFEYMMVWDSKTVNGANQRLRNIDTWKKSFSRPRQKTFEFNHD